MDTNFNKETETFNVELKEMTIVEGGSSGTPTNMVTTDTDQTITGEKTFTKPVNITDTFENDGYFCMVYGDGLLPQTDEGNGDFIPYKSIATQGFVEEYVAENAGGGASACTGYKWSSTWNNTAIMTKIKTYDKTFVVPIIDTATGKVDEICTSMSASKDYESSWVSANINSYKISGTKNSIVVKKDNLQLNHWLSDWATLYASDPYNLSVLSVEFLVKG